MSLLSRLVSFILSSNCNYATMMTTTTGNSNGNANGFPWKSIRVRRTPTEWCTAAATTAPRCDRTLLVVMAVVRLFMFSLMSFVGYKTISPGLSGLETMQCSARFESIEPRQPRRFGWFCALLRSSAGGVFCGSDNGDWLWTGLRTGLLVY